MKILTDVLLNRIVIAVLAAISAFAAAQWPAVHNQICTVLPLGGV